MAKARKASCANDDVGRCQSVKSHKKIRLEERGKKLIIINEQGHQFTCIQVDGCCQTTGRSADWILVKNSVGDLIVELKGKHVEHGISQIERTLIWWRGKNRCAKKIGAVIVSSQYPKFDTVIQRAKDRLMRDHGVRLRVKSMVVESEFEELL